MSEYLYVEKPFLNQLGGLGVESHRPRLGDHSLGFGRWTQLLAILGACRGDGRPPNEYVRLRICEKGIASWEENSYADELFIAEGVPRG